VPKVCLTSLILILTNGWQVLEILDFFTYINIKKLSTSVQMPPKKYNITKGSGFFPKRPNFSARLVRKFCQVIPVSIPMTNIKNSVLFKEGHTFLLSSYLPPTFLSPSAFTEMNVYHICLPCRRPRGDCNVLFGPFMIQLAVKQSRVFFPFYEFCPRKQTVGMLFLRMVPSVTGV